MINIYKTKKINNDIIFLKKTEWDIYYSKTLKYPLLVIQKLNENIGETLRGPKIVRATLGEPFKPDPKIPLKYCLTNEDYDNYMMYGGSPGHNAPAGQHKTTLAINKDTFLYSNICPQELSFNCSTWIMLEQWTEVLAKSKLFDTKTFVITGSIPNSHTNKFNTSNINIPTHMFKIVFGLKNNNLYLDCFIYDNKPTFNQSNTKLNKDLIIMNHHITLDKLISMLGKYSPDVEKLLLDYIPAKNKKNISEIFKNIKSISNLIPIKFNFEDNPKYIKRINGCKEYSSIIYSKNLRELEKVWSNLHKNDKFKPGFYHNKLYELANKRFYINNNLFKIKSKINKNSKKKLLNIKNKSRKIKNKF